MKCTVASLSELYKWGRMDPKFFIALHSVEERHNELLTQYPGAEEDPDAGKRAVRAILKKMTPAEKKACLVLSRGQPGWPGALEKVEKEYPHLALALIEPTLAKAMAEAEHELALQEDHWRELKKMGVLIDV